MHSSSPVYKPDGAQKHKQLYCQWLNNMWWLIDRGSRNATALCLHMSLVWGNNRVVAMHWQQLVVQKAWPSFDLCNGLDRGSNIYWPWIVHGYAICDFLLWNHRNCSMHVIHYNKDHLNTLVGIFYTEVPQVHCMLNYDTRLNKPKDIEYRWIRTQE